MSAWAAPVPRVVVVGAGMAGLAVVGELYGEHGASALLVDAHNYTTFPPLLFQLATCFIAPTDVARPVRSQLRRAPGVSFRMGRVVDVDWHGHMIICDDGGRVPFDVLVLAAGVVPAVATVAGADRHALPLMSISDAVRLRNRLLSSFERAAAHPSAAAAGDTSVVVIGGGPAGVELSGYIASFLFERQFIADYPQLDPSTMRISLLERGERLLPEFGPRLSSYARDTLAAHGVDVRLGVGVTEVDSDGVTLTGGERLLASTVVWAGGVDAPPWVYRCGLATKQGRVIVDPDLRVPGRPSVFVVGDLAAVPAADGGLHPQLAQVALQTGRHAGRAVACLLAGRPVRPFAYRDKGRMAIVGRNAAVVQVGRFELTGRPAWVAWGFLHLAYLPGVLNRMTTGLKYVWWHVSHENANRVLLVADPADGATQPVGAPPVRSADEMERT